MYILYTYADMFKYVDTFDSYSKIDLLSTGRIELP